MNNSAASHNNAVLKAALGYREIGWSVLPCSGKKPYMFPNGEPFKWAGLQVDPAPASHIHEWHKRGWLQNVGIICGEVSQNLVVIDLDGLQAIDKFAARFPDLMTSYRVKSGSGKGLHIYFEVDELPPTTRVSGTPFGGFELRANGSYVIAPPSIHPDTKQPYTFSGDHHVRRLRTMDDVVRWIKDIQVQKRRETAPRPTLPPDSRAPDNPQQRYFQKALLDHTRKVSSAGEGGRNDQLNLSAFILGGLIPHGLNRANAEMALREAALATGLPEAEVNRTIKSGIEAGIKKAYPVRWKHGS
jgi:hypothetical protein